MKKTLVLGLFIVLLVGIYGFYLYQNKKVTCDDCVVKYNLQDGEAKVLLGNKIVKIRTSEYAGKSGLIINEKEIKTLENGWTTFDKLYVFNDELLLITTTGDEYRVNDNYFYDKDLNPVSIDLTLDSNYPNSMVQYISTDLDVDNDKITIRGSRLNENLILIGEDSKGIKLCQHSGSATKYTKEHTGELLEAKYEAKYLGDYKFSTFKKIEDLRLLNEDICNYD